jgi:hypothetical protein
VSSTSQGRPPLLFITPQTNIAVAPSLGVFSYRPDAPVELIGRTAPRSVTLRPPRVLTFKRCTQNLNSHLPRANGQARPDAPESKTGRAGHAQPARVKPRPDALLELTRHVTLGVRFESSKHPRMTGRVRSIMTGRATTFDRPRVLHIFSGE